MPKHKGFLPRLSRRKFSLLLLAGAALCLCIVWLSAGYAERQFAAGMAATARDRLVLYSGTLHSALSKYGYLPHILATHPTIRQPLLAGGSPETIDAANRYLENVNDASGSMELFLLDKNGTCIAASNWNNSESFVGQDYSYRPYYRDALSPGQGRYFGVGATTGKPGFFFTEPVFGNGEDGEAVGVAVTKVDLAMLQREWRDGGETVFITDAQGIIFLASRDGWRYRATSPLSFDARDAMLDQRQYGATIPPDIDIRFSRRSDVDFMTLDGQTWLYTTQPLPEYGWTIWFLSPLTALDKQRETTWYIGLGSVLVALLLLILARVLSAWGRARRAALEAGKIRAINRRLAEEIRIRKKTEKDLLAAQDDLLHASRMAALGQVAASLTHELSQPVTSMSMFASSCRRLAEEGRMDKVAETVAHMQNMVQRIKSLIEQLKLFSRKSPGKLARVTVMDAVKNALTVLQFKQEATGCEPDVVCPQEAVDAVVMADALQLEQVLINLIQNALDAVHQVQDEEKNVTVSMAVTPGTVIIMVADNGPGIDPTVSDRIFTPFFTTKNSGEGIGLGLAIVDNIVRSLHGTIDLSAREIRGACFILTLPRAGGSGKNA